MAEAKIACLRGKISAVTEMKLRTNGNKIS